MTSHASISEIKSAYKQAALKYHPDKNPNDSEAPAKFIKLQADYEFLCDEKKEQKSESDSSQSFKEFPYDASSQAVERYMGIRFKDHEKFEESSMTDALVIGSLKSFISVYLHQYPSRLRAGFGDSQLRMIAKLTAFPATLHNVDSEQQQIFFNRVKEAGTQTAGHFYEIVRIIAPFVNLDTELEDQATYLTESVICGNLAMTQALIDSKVDVNFQLRTTGTTALHQAVELDEKTTPQKINIVKSLLNAGADPCLSDKNGQTPLLDCYILKTSVDIKIAEAVTKKASNPNLISTKYRITPFNGGCYAFRFRENQISSYLKNSC